MERSCIHATERGFTLIELLTVMGILSVLMGLGLTSLRAYRQNASNTAATASLRDAITDVEGALNNVDQIYAVVSFDQTTAGPLLDPAARAALTTFSVPKNMQFHVEFDQACDNATCTQVFLLSKHCWGSSDMQYMRLGDGLSLYIETASTGAC